MHAQSNASPEDAVGSLKLLAGYIVDAQLKQSLRGALRDSYLASKLRDREIETLVINKSLHLHDLEQTLKDMKEIAGRAPPLPVWKGEGLISNVGDAGRYLPPRVQVTGIESMMSTLRAEIRELAMERGRVDIRLGFYRKLYEVMPESSTGTQMLEFFRAFVRDYFAKSGDSEDVRVIRNEFIAVADNLVAQRLDRPYFTAGPSVPGSRTGSLPIFGAVFMLVILGVGFSVGLALMVSAVSIGWKKGAAPVTLPDQMPVADYCNRGG